MYEASCHVIIRNHLSLSMRGVAAGANPSLASGRGQGAQLITGLTDEQCGVQYLAQGQNV